MSFRLSRRFSAFLCGGLLALTLLVGHLVAFPLGSTTADFPPGPYKTASVSSSGDYPPGPYKTASIMIPYGIIVQG